MKLMTVTFDSLTVSLIDICTCSEPHLHSVGNDSWSHDQIVVDLNIDMRGPHRDQPYSYRCVIHSARVKYEWI